jgi:hypothetical protein
MSDTLSIRIREGRFWEKTRRQKVLGNRCPKTALIHRKTHQIAYGRY